VSGPSPHARAFAELRPRVLARLLELRASLDPGLVRADEHTARTQLDALLEHLGNYLATGDANLHRAFLNTFLAMRAAEAQGPAAALGTLVAVGDAAAQVAQEELASRPEGAELVTVLTRVTAATARLVNDLVAEELERRLAQRRQLDGEADEPDTDTDTARRV
jgi:hypothetical protein